MAVSAQTEIPSQLGRSAVVTGGTGGLGYETAVCTENSNPDVMVMELAEYRV
jgi:short-subunit dehydrogenase